MGEIVNLRRVKKQLARQEAGVTAAAKRASHGLSKAERLRAAAEGLQADRVLDGAKLDDRLGKSGE